MENETNGGTVATAVQTSATSEQTANALETIVVAGNCTGFFRYGDVEKEFKGNHVVLVRPSGSIVVHSANRGIKPVCYIDEGAEIALARNMADAEIEISAMAQDGREILVTFSKVESISGLSSGAGEVGVEQAVLRCVKQANGRYGRTTVARILSGSASKRILTLRLWTLGLYGALSSTPLKEIVQCIDDLIAKGMLEVREKDDYPTVWLTEAGEKAAGETVPAPKDAQQSECIMKALRDWRAAKAGKKPAYLVMQNRTIAEIAERKPQTAQDLSMVYGIGDSRLTSYGTEILDIVRACDN